MPVICAMKTHKCCSELRTTKSGWLCDAITESRWTQANQIRFLPCRRRLSHPSIDQFTIQNPTLCHKGEISGLQKRWKIEITDFFFVELHRLCQEATKMLMRLQSTHFPIRHSRMGSHSQFTISLNNKAISKTISQSNRRHQSQLNMSITRHRLPLELASAHNWLATTSKRSTTKTRPFRTRWDHVARKLPAR